MREAANRINAQRHHWIGVGLMAVENLQSGATSAILIPDDAERPDWSVDLRHALSDVWLRSEDVCLVQYLFPKWWNSLSHRPDRRWTEFFNLMHLSCPAHLLAGLPAPSRRLSVIQGVSAHALPISVAPSTEILDRLIAWLFPWERISLRDGHHACAYWLSPTNVPRLWAVPCALGDGGRTREERMASGGMAEWGVVLAWPCALDAMVVFLLAQADALEAVPPVEGAPEAPAPASARRQRRGGVLSKDRRAVVLVAVHEALTGKTYEARPGQPRQFAAYEWARCSKALNVHAALAGIRLDWCPDWYLERLHQEHGTALTVADLLGTAKTAEAFATDVRKGMKSKQRAEPAVPVPSGEKAHGGT